MNALSKLHADRLPTKPPPVEASALLGNALAFVVAQGLLFSAVFAQVSNVLREADNMIGGPDAVSSFFHRAHAVPTALYVLAAAVLFVPFCVGFVLGARRRIEARLVERLRARDRDAAPRRVLWRTDEHFESRRAPIAKAWEAIDPFDPTPGDAAPVTLDALPLRPGARESRLLSPLALAGAIVGTLLVLFLGLDVSAIPACALTPPTIAWARRRPALSFKRTPPPRASADGLTFTDTAIAWDSTDLVVVGASRDHARCLLRTRTDDRVRRLTFSREHLAPLLALTWSSDSAPTDTARPPLTEAARNERPVPMCPPLAITRPLSATRLFLLFAIALGVALFAASSLAFIDRALLAIPIADATFDPTYTYIVLFPALIVTALARRSARTCAERVVAEIHAEHAGALTMLDDDAQPTPASRRLRTASPKAPQRVEPSYETATLRSLTSLHDHNLWLPLMLGVVYVPMHTLSQPTFLDALLRTLELIIPVAIAVLAVTPGQMTPGAFGWGPVVDAEGVTLPHPFRPDRRFPWATTAVVHLGHELPAFSRLLLVDTHANDHAELDIPDQRLPTLLASLAAAHARSPAPSIPPGHA